jgi:hypothetical protein
MNEREIRELAGHLNDISVALHALDRHAAMLVEIERFVVASETGIDPLQHTIYANDSDGEEDDSKPPSWVNGK